MRVSGGGGGEVPAGVGGDGGVGAVSVLVLVAVDTVGRRHQPPLAHQAGATEG